MGVIDGAVRWLAEHQVPDRRLSLGEVDVPIELQVAAATRNTVVGARPWRVPTVRDALGVPSNLRCVTLISGATAALSVAGYRSGAPMNPTPTLLARPNPYDTPWNFYRDSAWNMATRGEVVWFVASVDGSGRPAALVVVPLHELTVEENADNRLRPTYRWGDVTSTRYSPATPDGRFVHVVFARDPGDLRGSGPLQLTRTAVSVAVESQEWAANFYAVGGPGTTELHSAEELEDWETADLKAQWTANPPNVPQVTSGDIEVRDHDVNPNGAQMLEGRQYANGDSARTFGVPGALLEYASGGSSLTYQNIAEVFTLFVRSSLSINYLEPMEQALSDLLPRPMSARFNVDAFLRADPKTRWEIYEIASRVIGVTDAATIAREREGIDPGDIEYRPIPFAAPSVVPSSLPVAAGGVRCDGMRMLRGRMEPCGRKLADAGPFVGTCPRCKKEYRAA